MTLSSLEDFFKQSKICTFRRRTPGQHAQLLSCLGDICWGDLLAMSDVQAAFDMFYEIVVNLFESIYPLKKITVTNFDPKFVTPQIKAMLRMRNRLMHRGKTLAADSITAQIQRKITAFNKARLSSSVVKRGSKELWNTVAQITGKSKHVDIGYPVDADTLNNYFASISTDTNYLPPTPRVTVNKYTDYFSEQSVFRILDTVKQTATGLDCIPSWFLRTAAPFLSLPIAHLFNLSLSFSVVPVQWKSSSITPVPKVALPKTCQDFRPISVTPVLSRLMEKEFIRNTIYPVLVNPNYTHLFSDQFAFRPTGSTTSALIHLLHTLSNMLQTEPYVHVIALDFSKAFDTVRHHTLLSKFSKLPISDSSYNWLLDYFSSRRHCTRVKEIISEFLEINASIIQGSGTGPISYVVNASDLRTIFLLNILFKYADDTYLIVPASLSHTIEQELKSIADWAAANNLTLNTKKSTEIIIFKPKSNNANLPPPPIPGIQRVDQLVVLGVTIHERLSFKPHIDKVVSRCAQTFYALRVLRADGLSGSALWDVSNAILISRILYASPVWWGFIDVSDKQRLQSIVNKAQKNGFLSPSQASLADMCQIADAALFSDILGNRNHVLHGLLPPVQSTGYQLRPRAHDRVRPQDANPLLRQNFIYRNLANDYFYLE